MHENTIKAILENSLGYIWFMVLALWGGTASYISRLKRSGSHFSIIELMGEWTISGFTGIVTAYMCYSFGLDYYKTAALTGISGHLGGRGMFMLETWLKKRYLGAG